MGDKDKSIKIDFHNITEGIQIQTNSNRHETQSCRIRAALE